MINIVMGPACSGKSHFIKENFKDYKVIDLFDFQQKLEFVNVETLMKAYEQTRDALIESIKNNENVVLEHTLLKSKRRPMYIDAIKEITNEPIIIYVMNPSPEKLVEYSIKRDCEYSLEEAKWNLDFMEIPTKDEGFSEIHIIT